MAPPHTMKYKARSPTTLTPALEAMHLSFIPDSPSTPPPKTYKVLSPKLSPKANRQIAAALATMSEQNLLLFFFARACSDQQKSAVKDIDAAISKIKHNTEALAVSDSEERLKDSDYELVVHIMDANHQFVKGYDRYIGLLEADAKSKGIEVWSVEVRQIEGLVGEWEAVYPDGEWSTSIMKLGDIDEKIVVDWGIVKEKVFKLWEKKKQKERGDKSDTESVASRESKGSDDTESDVGNESMEYISPSKIVAKEEKQDAFTTPERSGLRTPEQAPTADFATPLPPKVFELNFSPARRSAKSLRSKSPRSSSPVQGTPTPAQSMPATLQSMTLDFSVAKPTPAEATLIAATPKYTFGSGSGPRFTTAPIIYLPGASGTFESAQATGNDDQKKPEAAVTVTPLNPILPSASRTMEFARATTETKAVVPENPPPQPIFNLGTLRPSPISTPPITPSLPSSSSNFSDFSKPLPNGREMKTLTSSTLTALTKTTQSLQNSVNDVRSALYGLGPNTLAPESAKDAGLLLMNNYIGEWVTDLRIQTNTLKTKVNEIGTRVQSITQDFATLKSTTSNAISEVATAVAASEVVAGRNHAETLNEIKEMMTEQMKEIQEMRQHEQTSFASLLRQNNDLMQELAKLKEVQRTGEEEVKMLRAENREFKKMVDEEAKLLRGENRELKKLVEKSTKKVEFAVAHQLGLEACEKEDEGDMDDALMEVLWPQGWDEDEGVRKRDEGKVLERGVLADEPGFRIPKHRLGRGKEGGGWCTVM